MAATSQEQRDVGGARLSLVTGLGRARSGLAVALFSFLTVILSTGIRGDWLLIYIQLKKIWGNNSQGPLTSPNEPVHIDDTNATASSQLFNLEKYHMQDVHFYIAESVLGAFLIFYSAGGWLKWYYYIQRRERAAEWKCQPDRFLSVEDDRFEFWLGTFNMALGACISGVLVAYIMNGGETQFYYQISDYGWGYFLLTIPLVYFYNEAVTYYSHRMMHVPFFYRRYHKLHHRFKAPTPWSAAAMHPYEFLIFQFLLQVPIFLVPQHAGVFLFWLIYGLYYGIRSHSGIDLKHTVPWQPSVFFHDDHHKYFHCNFGVNTEIFDWLHGTLRRPDRVYSETIFGGRGADPPHPHHGPEGKTD